MWKRGPAREYVMTRIVELITQNGSALTLPQICGYLRPVANYDIYNALMQLRDDGILACTNGRWWKRQRRS